MGKFILKFPVNNLYFILCVNKDIMYSINKDVQTRNRIYNVALSFITRESFRNRGSRSCLTFNIVF